jgi:hypothetical protein
MSRIVRIADLRSTLAEIYRAGDEDTLSDVYLRIVGYDPFPEILEDSTLDDVRCTLVDYIKEIAASEDIHWLDVATIV